MARHALGTLPTHQCVGMGRAYIAKLEMHEENKRIRAAAACSLV
jgi:hypothetical protein